MYDAFYGFTSEPFRLSPDAHFCYRHRSFSKAKSYFTYALHHGEGFVLVTGRPGTGKTTLIEDLLKDLIETGILTVRVDSAQLQADDLLRRVAYAFGVEGSGIDKATLLHRLERYLHQRVRENGKALLIVDEAQTLSSEGLEELRLITNLTNCGQPLMQIFLVGQESLRDLITDPTLEQLHQRILCACHLDPLPLQETRDYLAHRLRCAGWRGNPAIDSEAIRALHRGSGGIPRLINKLTDRLLLHGALEEKRELTAEDTEYVLHELRTEMLLTVDLLPGSDAEESQVKIEDIRLHHPPTVTTTDADQATAREPTQPQIEDQEESEVSNVPTTSLPLSQEDLNRLLFAAHGAAEPGRIEVGARVHPATDNDGDARSRTDASTSHAITGNGTPRPIDRRISTPPVDQDPAGDPSRQRPRVTRQIGTHGAGVVLALLIVLFGGGLFLVRDGGMTSIDGLTGLLSNVHARLLSMAGRNVPDGGEAAIVVDPVGPQPAYEATEPDAAEKADSVEQAAAARNAPLKPRFEQMVDSTPHEESSAPTPASADELPTDGPTTETNRSEERGSMGSIESPETTGTDESTPTPPRSLDPADTPFASVAAETQALGIETELVRPSQIRLILRKAVAFRFDSARVPKKSRAILDQLSAILVEHDAVRARIVGHTDHIGSRAYNRILSARRAKAIERHFVSRGISPDRLSSEGKGEAQPLVPLATEDLSRDQLIANRRIEVWIEPIDAE